MKLKRLPFKQEMTLWIVFDGVNAICCAYRDNYILSGVFIAFGIIMIYFRETYGDYLP